MPGSMPHALARSARPSRAGGPKGSWTAGLPRWSGRLPGVEPGFLCCAVCLAVLVGTGLRLLRSLSNTCWCVLSLDEWRRQGSRACLFRACRLACRVRCHAASSHASALWYLLSHVRHVVTQPCGHVQCHEGHGYTTACTGAFSRARYPLARSAATLSLLALRPLRSFPYLLPLRDRHRCRSTCEVLPLPHGLPAHLRFVVCSSLGDRPRGPPGSSSEGTVRHDRVGRCVAVSLATNLASSTQVCVSYYCWAAASASSFGCCCGSVLRCP